MTNLSVGTPVAISIAQEYIALCNLENNKDKNAFEDALYQQYESIATV